MALPEGPGLGVELNEAFLARSRGKEEKLTHERVR
jgi:hypothetical protein